MWELVSMTNSEKTGYKKRVRSNGAEAVRLLHEA